jgi:hypothetical protein
LLGQRQHRVLRSSGLCVGSFHDWGRDDAIDGGLWRVEMAFDDECVILPCGSSSSIYDGAGPPLLQRWRGSSSPTTAWIHDACRHSGPRAWEARPQRWPPPACNTGFGDGGRCPPSSASGSVYERQIDDGGPGSGPRGLRSGLVNFLLLLKIDLWCWLT